MSLEIFIITRQGKLFTTQAMVWSVFFLVLSEEMKHIMNRHHKNSNTIVLIDDWVDFHLTIVKHSSFSL